jgi:hypothetical protein
MNAGQVGELHAAAAAPPLSDGHRFEKALDLVFSSAEAAIRPKPAMRPVRALKPDSFALIPMEL